MTDSRPARAESLLLTALLVSMMFAVLAAAFLAAWDDARTDVTLGSCLRLGTTTSALLLVVVWIVFGALAWYLRLVIAVLLFVGLHSFYVFACFEFSDWMYANNWSGRYRLNSYEFRQLRGVARGSVYCLPGLALMLCAVRYWFGWQLRRETSQVVARNAQRNRKIVLFSLVVVLGGAQILMGSGVLGIDGTGLVSEFALATIGLLIVVIGVVVPWMWGMLGIGKTVIRILVTVIISLAVAAWAATICVMDAGFRLEAILSAALLIGSFSAFWFGTLGALRYCGYRLHGYQRSDFVRPQSETAPTSPFDD